MWNSTGAAESIPAVIYRENPPLFAKGRLARYAASSWYYACEEDPYGLWVLNKNRVHMPLEGGCCLILGDLQHDFRGWADNRRNTWYPVFAADKVLAVPVAVMRFHDEPWI